MDRVSEERAKARLRSVLEDMLGPSLPGVAGYGVGLDRRTREIGLNVRVDQPVANRLKNKSLPDKILGLPVRVSVTGVGRLD